MCAGGSFSSLSLEVTGLDLPGVGNADITNDHSTVFAQKLLEEVLALENMFI